MSDSGRVCMHLGTSICDTRWFNKSKKTTKKTSKFDDKFTEKLKHEFKQFAKLFGLFKLLLWQWQVWNQSRSIGRNCCFWRIHGQIPYAAKSATAAIANSAKSQRRQQQQDFRKTKENWRQLRRKSWEHWCNIYFLRYCYNDFTKKLLILRNYNTFTIKSLFLTLFEKLAMQNVF